MTISRGTDTSKIFAKLYGTTCDRCGRCRPAADLNYEGRIHHHHHVLECMDRVSCERACRKRNKKERRRA